MIVTSMRCYLNILTQLMTKDELLNAQYYIADKTTGTRYQMREYWNPDTEQYETIEGDNTVDTASEYLVRYTSSSANCNMAAMLTGFKQLDIDKIAVSNHPRDRINAYIHRELFMMALYNELIANIRKDKLMIVIFTDDDTVRYGADLFCEMVSKDFGQDITFIDPQYRPYVHGRVSYIGDKARGEMVISKIRDKALIAGFMSALAHNNYESSTNNIKTYFKNFDTTLELIQFHDLLWPDDKIKPGTYTFEDISDIIIGKAMEEEDSHLQRMPNIQIINSNYQSMMTNR